MLTGSSNDDRVLALFSETPRLSWEEVRTLSKMQRLMLLQTLTRLVDKGLLRRVVLDKSKTTATTYFELRKQ